jgi:PAS domain-containing protein
VTQIELSVSESFVPDPVQPVPTGSVEHWATAVRDAPEPCLVINSLSIVVAASPSACALLGFDVAKDAAGLHLFSGALRLLDFTAAGAALSDSDMEKIPPVLACSSGRLARGLLRVQSGAEVLTVDAIATPLFDGHTAAGSLTFFSKI